MINTMIDQAGGENALLLSLAGGLLLGGVYFGGLWFSVKQAPHWHYPGLSMALSLLLRLALVGFGLYWLADGFWQRYAAALPGLLIARWLWLRHARSLWSKA